MVYEYELRVSPREAFNEESIKEYLTREKGLTASDISSIRITQRSIDARQRNIIVNLKILVFIDQQPSNDEFNHIDYPDVSDGKQVIVIGEGPGGLFASLRLIELGLCPIILERGKDVHSRKRDLALIAKTKTINEESNFCFGEGGAGAYSDGKLYTRSKKRGNVKKILNVFCQHGAPTSLLADAHPHIGTDRLPRVIENMRNTILKSGGKVFFQTKMVELILEHTKQRYKVVGVKAIDSSGLQPVEREFYGCVILATGHSARDIYEYFNKEKLAIEAKGFAMGVRLEHPSHLIDQIQYHNPMGRGKYLPAAEYNFVTQIGGRGVYSFCMCPGGFVIPAATKKGELVVNGMSPSNRGGKWSNSGMVVEIRPNDIDSNDPLRLMQIQQHFEANCFQQGQYCQTAPAQRMDDFVNGRLSTNLPTSSYAPGLVNSPLHLWMPQNIANKLREAFRLFGKKSHGFLTNEATVIAGETRTSSPVRLLRDRQTLMHIQVEGLFPCGEGAGYAGGIVSAGIDGERCAECCAKYLSKAY